MKRSAPSAGARPRRGRPRDARVDAAIRDATLALLAEGGYARATFEAVAERAGLQRPAIYRRFPDRAALVAAAVRGALATANPVIPHGADAARDLATVLRNLITHLTETPLGPALRSVVSPLAHDRALRDAAAAVQRERQAVLLTILRPLALEALLGAIYFRLLLTPRPARPGYERALVALVAA
jgi:AcrR family transcriptional regulator